MPEPTAEPAPAQVSMSYGAVPFDLAAGTEQWWSIDSSDSAYWAVQENINAMRAAGGLAPLTMDSGLSAAADARCESFVAGAPFDHSGMTTRSEICAAGPLGSASAVLRLPESRRTSALEKIARDKLSVREADRLVDAMLAAPKDTPGPCRSTVPMVGDVRLFVNTLQHAVDLMTQRGIPAVTSCEQADGFLEYTVRIPTGTPAPLPVPNTLPACHEPEMPSGEGSNLGEEDELVRS